MSRYNEQQQSKPQQPHRSSLTMIHRRRLQQQQQQQQRLMKRTPSLDLPVIISTGTGRVWKRIDSEKLIYQDSDSPNKLLHVIPDINDDNDNNDDDQLPSSAVEKEGHSSSTNLNTAATTTTTTTTSTKRAILRCPDPLPYIGRPLPVAPSLPHPRYLVRPRFPVVDIKSQLSSSS